MIILWVMGGKGRILSHQICRRSNIMKRGGLGRPKSRTTHSTSGLLFLGTIIVVALVVGCAYLVSSGERTLRNIAAFTTSSAVAKSSSTSETSWGSSVALADDYLPIIPIPPGDTDAGNAMQQFFHYADTTTGGLIDLSKLKSTDMKHLRALAKSIKGGNITCGKPRVITKRDFITQVADDSNGLEYCFWANDLVSTRAMNDFGWERSEWNWVVESFLDDALQNNTSCLAFLDVGVNVGDWASPIRVALPNVPIFGVEGMPSSAAVAAANMLTSVEYHRSNGNAVAPTVLLPFPLLSWRSLEKAKEEEGVCFRVNDANIGGSGVDTSSKRGSLCPPKSSAGATYFPHALKHMANHFQPSCSNTGVVWPSIYIAKLDIEGSEFSVLSSAMDWLQQRPPCYLILGKQNLTTPLNLDKCCLFAKPCAQTVVVLHLH